MGAVGVERSGSCGDTVEEVTAVLGPGINQIWGVRAREGCKGSVLDAAWWEDGDRDKAEVKMRPSAQLCSISIHLSSNSLTR